jgi:predicted dehydrogenase
VRLAVVGAGLIGRRHVAHVLAGEGVRLAAIVDPAPAAQALAAESGTPWHPGLAALLESDRPDGVIIATPNRMHVADGLAAVAAGIPALVEKPIADDVAAASALVEAAEQAGVPLLVGHHRRHNPLIAAAKRAIDDGRLGRIVAIHGMCWLHKPADYFAPAWRREKGAGPVFINLIHDIDLLRHLCGEVTAVQAMESNALRGNAVEETAVMLLRFASGALATVTVSDIVAAPWSWELTSGENPAYSHTSETCFMIGGTDGSLAIPQLDLWAHEGTPHWWHRITRERLAAAAEDPLVLQIRNFRDVIRGTAAPVVSGREGLETLRVTAAVKQAAASGALVAIDRGGPP